MKTTTTLKLFAITTLIVAATVFVSACGDSADGDAAEHVDDAAEHVDDAAEHVDDAADGDADADHADSDGEADGADHDAADEPGDTNGHDADEHSDADDNTDGGEHDPEALAYLEAAPKDSLFLVDMSVLSFTPGVLEVKAGEVIEIAIQNSEAALHDFTIDEVDADVHISYLGGTGQHEHEEPAKKADVHFALTEPGSGVVHLKIHEPGEYVFYCSVPGHQAAGMEGKLIVTEA